MAQFLLLLRGGDFPGDDPHEMEEIVKKYKDWTETLINNGIHQASQPLKNTGRILSVEQSKIVDGPFTETKEAIGGFFLIKSPDYDTAVDIAKNCPHLQFNGEIEVREVAVI